MTPIIPESLDPTGQSLCTRQIQTALDAAANTGRTVLIPPGRYLVGTLLPRSNSRLQFLPGATLLGSPDIADYPPISQQQGKDRQPHHLILLDRVHHVEIVGPGIIDGNGPSFWNPPAGPATQLTPPWKRERTQRPSPMIQITHCRDIHLRDFTIANSPGWTLHLHNCDFVFVHAVQVHNDLFGPNTDGFDISGCRDVFISDCHLTCGDDAIVIKTPHDSRSAERITVTNCTIRTHCVALKCGTESFHDFRQITFANCVCFNSHRIFGLYAKDGGIIEDITVTNITGDTHTVWNDPITPGIGRADAGLILPRPIHIDCNLRDPDSRPSRIRNITVSNFIASTVGRILLTAQDGLLLENIKLRDIHLTYPDIEDPAITAPLSKSAQFSNGSAADTKAARAAIVAENIRNLSLHDLTIDWPTPPSPVPMHILWARNVQGGIIDTPLATAQGRDRYATSNTNLIIR